MLVSPACVFFALPGPPPARLLPAKGFVPGAVRTKRMKRGERCLWCAGIAVAAIAFLAAAAWIVLQSDATERYVASRMFSEWVDPRGPEHSVLVWDRLTGVFPARFKIYGARWRNTTCLSDECVVAFCPLIDVSVHPLAFLFGGTVAVEQVTLPHLALVESDRAASISRRAGGRRLMGAAIAAEWPEFPYDIHFKTFRIDRLSVLGAAEMAAAVADASAHPYAQPRVAWGRWDVVFYGSAQITGGDWRVAASVYALAADGDLDPAYHIHADVSGVGVTRTVAGSVRAAAGEMLDLRAEGAARWDVLVGENVETDPQADVELRGPWGWVTARMGGAGVVNISSSWGVGVAGTLGAPSEWPRHVTVTSPWGAGECGSRRCAVSTHGQELDVFPLSNGIRVVHAYAAANVTGTRASAPVDNAWLHAAAALAGTPRVVAAIDSVFGSGRAVLDGGTVTEFTVAGDREHVRVGPVAADRVVARVNMTCLTVVATGVLVPGLGRVDETWFELEPGRWNFTTTAGDHLAGTASREGVFGGGVVHGITVDGLRVVVGNGTRVYVRASHEESWVTGSARVDPWAESWWERMPEYAVRGVLDASAYRVWSGHIGGRAVFAVTGGGRQLPAGTVDVIAAEGTLFNQHFRDVSGNLAIPSGRYRLTGNHTSEWAAGSFVSKGNVVVAPHLFDATVFTVYSGETENVVESTLTWTW